MDSVAISSKEDRQALFGETGAALGVANTIAEKDFWVCWTLKRLFELQDEDVPTLVFKGGTSLSKAFGAIRRFSEDIDLSIDRADLGYTGDRDPENPDLSRKAADKLIDALKVDVETYLRDKLRPALLKSFTAQLGKPRAAGWSLEIDSTDPQNLIFHYPKSLSEDDYADMTYVTPRVKLEFGARGDPWPSEERVIRSYAAEEFPDFFEDPSCTVTVLSAERTFWEKVTALHAEAHRPTESPAPQYFSRHYYDVAMLLDIEQGQAASEDFDLLAQVVQHKKVFFRSAWANYDAAKPGSLKIVPPDARLNDLRADYRDMAEMMFDGEPPTFDEIIARLQVLEDAINA